MNNILSIDRVGVKDKSVIVRIDAEVNGQVDGPRMKSIEQIVRLLVDRKARRIKLVGHKGGGLVRSHLLNWWDKEIEIEEELRNDPREEENNEVFAGELARGFDIYVNEAFSVCHRKHTSTHALPALMKHSGKLVCAGTRLLKEIQMLDKVWQMKGSKILVVGGAKAEHKAWQAVRLALKMNEVLVGGTLGDQIQNSKVKVQKNIKIAKLREDELDISDESIGVFVDRINRALGIVLAGPMGKFENEDSEKGTEMVFTAVAHSGAFKVAGGGNTEVALDKYGLRDRFDWISVGGGAMLEYLALGTLPGLEVLSA